MRRVLMVLAVAALMAAMIASTAPAAMAQDSFSNTSDFTNSFDVVQYNDNFYVFDDGGYDCYWWGDCYWGDYAWWG